MIPSREPVHLLLFCALTAAALFVPAEAMAGDDLVRSERLKIWAQLAEAPAIAIPLRPLLPTIPVDGIQSRDLRDTFDAPRSHGRRHHAIDIMAPANTAVVAAVDGTIRRMKSSRSGGRTIYELDESGRRVYYYAHLQGYRAGLREGCFVRRGEIIGYVGTTGNATPGAPHLHFAIADLPPSLEWWKGSPVNPYPLLAGNPSADHRVVTVSTPRSMGGE